MTEPVAFRFDGMPPSRAAPCEDLARVQVHTAAGDTLSARAASRDLLSALRLSFNSVEAELDTAGDGAPARWISSVRNRLVQRHGVA